MKPSFSNAFKNVYGGPCPTCEKSGYLLTDTGEYGTDGSRTITHVTDAGYTECEIPLSLGWIRVFPNGLWKFLSH